MNYTMDGIDFELFIHESDDIKGDWGGDEELI